MTECTERSEGREGMPQADRHDRVHRAQRGPRGHASGGLEQGYAAGRTADLGGGVGGLTS
jgi:hypothetical protein